MKGQVSNALVQVQANHCVPSQKNNQVIPRTIRNTATRFFFPHFFPLSRAITVATPNDMTIIAKIIQSFIRQHKTGYRTDRLKEPQYGSRIAKLALPAKLPIQLV